MIMRYEYELFFVQDLHAQPNFKLLVHEARNLNSPQEDKSP